MRMIASDWISFKDRLPEPGQKIILTFGGSCCFDLIWNQKVTLATHWMPFVPPEPALDPFEEWCNQEHGPEGQFSYARQWAKAAWDAALKWKESLE